MGSSATLPAKKDVARGLLLRGTVFVHLDPRGEGVIVPPWLQGNPQLVLQVGLDMPVPILDLRVDDEGVFGTLSFSRSPFTCSVPWSAVFAVVGEDGRGMVWPDSMPDEIRAEVEREAGLAPAPALREVEGPSPDAPLEDDAEVVDLADRRTRSDRTDGPEAPDPRPARGRRRARRRDLPPYLRVVK